MNPPDYAVMEKSAADAQPKQEKVSGEEIYMEALADKEFALAALFTALVGLIEVVRVAVQAEFTKRKS